MKFLPFSLPSRISHVIGDIASTLPSRTWVYFAQLDSCSRTYEICRRLLPSSHFGQIKRIDDHCMLPLSVLDKEAVRDQLFVGFDEIYLSSEPFASPKPSSLVLSCIAISDFVMTESAESWLEGNECMLGMGDGFVLNVLAGYRDTTRIEPALRIPLFGTFVPIS